MKRHTKIGALTLGIACAATVFAAPAQADESSYLNALNNAGYYGPIITWLAIGYGVCGRQGATIGQLTQFVYENTDSTVGYAAAERVVELAEIYLC